MSTIDSRVKELLSKPSLEGLSYALRHPEVWPKEFAWDFVNPCCCGMGLTDKLWPEYDDNTVSYCETFKCTEPFFHRWFIEGFDYGVAREAVQPHHVADTIDAYLATRG